MQSFTRGATVTISVVFRDAEGDVTSPSAATAVLSYRNGSQRRARMEVALSLDGDAWTGTWDSRVARQGKVYCHVRTAEPVPLSADDFVFMLVANEANEVA